MMTQYHYKCYELDLQKIVKYALDYNGNCLCLKTLFIISGNIPLAALKISVASACILLWWIETGLTLCKSYPKF